MSKIIDNLYVGDIDDAGDEKWLTSNNITHILSGIENAKWLPDAVNASGRQHLCFEFDDLPESNIAQYFEQVVAFIHKARLNNEGVLVHCYMGMSRSVTFAISYVHCISGLPIDDCLTAIRKARHIAYPNPGFVDQLLEFSQNNDTKTIIQPYSGQSEDIQNLNMLISQASELSKDFTPFSKSK